MTNDDLPSPGINELIVEFAGNLPYPPGYLERERGAWDRDSDDTELKPDPESASHPDTPE